MPTATSGNNVFYSRPASGATDCKVIFSCWQNFLRILCSLCIWSDRLRRHKKRSSRPDDKEWDGSHFDLLIIDRHRPHPPCPPPPCLVNHLSRYCFIASTCVTWCSHRPSCLPTLVSRALHVHISCPISQLHVYVTRNHGCQEGDISVWLVVWLHLRVI